MEQVRLRAAATDAASVRSSGAAAEDARDPEDSTDGADAKVAAAAEDADAGSSFTRHQQQVAHAHHAVTAESHHDADLGLVVPPASPTTGVGLPAVATAADTLLAGDDDTAADTFLAADTRAVAIGWLALVAWFRGAWWLAPGEIA